MNNDEALQDTSRLLKSVSYFAALDASSLQLVARSATRRVFDAGQVIFLEGEPCAGLYVVERGWLKVIKIGMDGREQVLQMLGPGDACNAISVFTTAPNQATVIALEASQVWLVRREPLLHMLDEHPALARQVVKDLAGRVMHLVQMVEDLSLRSVEARLARLLLELAEDETIQRRRWATQAEMAARLGTVPDVVNRALRKLAAAGLIFVERQQIQILDRTRLRVIAQVDA
jgi:CRP/FNR family transcriptional regulator